MNLDDLTIGEARKLASMFGGVQASALDALVGKAVVIRTVTYHYIGRLAAVTPTELVLDEASWLADSGRWHQALKTGVVSEVEPYPGRCYVSRGAVVDVSEWLHALPKDAE